MTNPCGGPLVLTEGIATDPKSAMPPEQVPRPPARRRGLIVTTAVPKHLHVAGTAYEETAVVGLVHRPVLVPQIIGGPRRGAGGPSCRCAWLGGWQGLQEAGHDGGGVAAADPAALEEDGDAEVAGGGDEPGVGG